MAKRFTATDKWKDGWFFSLTTEQKLFWMYLLDDCDAAGIWEVNYTVASSMIGIKVTEEWAKACIGDRAIEFKTGKWFIPKFIDFQYGELSELSKPHKSIIRMLQRYGLYEGYLKGIYTIKEKEQVQEKEKAQEQESAAQPEKPATDPKPTVQAASRPDPFAQRIEDKKILDEYQERWNKFADRCGLTKCEAITPTRAALVLEKHREKWFDLGKVLKAASQTPFALGDNDIGYELTFAKLFEGDTALKILEGAHPWVRGAPGSKRKQPTAAEIYEKIDRAQLA